GPASQLWRNFRIAGGRRREGRRAPHRDPAPSQGRPVKSRTSRQRHIHHPRDSSVSPAKVRCDLGRLSNLFRSTQAGCPVAPAKGWLTQGCSRSVRNRASPSPPSPPTPLRCRKPSPAFHWDQVGVPLPSSHQAALPWNLPFSDPLPRRRPGFRTPVILTLLAS